MSKEWVDGKDEAEIASLEPGVAPRRDKKGSSECPR
jgi:hypothetical protein